MKKKLVIEVHFDQEDAAGIYTDVADVLTAVSNAGVVIQKVDVVDLEPPKVTRTPHDDILDCEDDTRPDAWVPRRDKPWPYGRPMWEQPLRDAAGRVANLAAESFVRGFDGNERTRTGD